MTDWIIKQDLSICCLKENHFRTKDTHRLKARGWEKIFPVNRNKKAGAAILILDKVDFKTKSVTKAKEGHYVMIKIVGDFFFF